MSETKQKLESFNQEKHQQVSEKIQEALKDLENKHLEGQALRSEQKKSLINLSEWLKHSKGEALRGHIVVLPGRGKTGIAILMDEIIGGKNIFFSWNRLLAEKTAEKFQQHQESLEQSQQRSLGKIYQGQKTIDKDFTITTFQSRHKWENEINWDEINIVFVDEGDVNGLSKKRREFLEKISEKHGVIVLGLSATEQQASGKTLQDSFPDQILYHPIPDSLQEMREQKGIPELNFRDLHLDLQFRTDNQAIKRHKLGQTDIEAKTVGQFIKSSSWNDLVLEDHLSNHVREDGSIAPSVVVFRDNTPVNDMVERAKTKGIAAVALTGELSDQERKKVIDGFNNGRYDMIVGSILPGRGTDLPTAEVVYNCMITWSPQKFWQSARATRLDPNNPNKVGKLITVLPRWFTDKGTGLPLPNELKPLSHASYFDPSYFPKELIEEGTALKKGRLQSQKFSQLNLSDVKIVRSNHDIASIQEKIRKRAFVGRHLMMAKAIESMETFGIQQLKFVEKSHPLRLKNLYLHTKDESDPSIEAFKLENDITVISAEEEKELIKTYKLKKDSKNPTEKREAEAAIAKLLAAFDPLIDAIIEKNIENKDDHEDIKQDVHIRMLNMINSYNSIMSRFVTYALIGIYRTVERTKKYDINYNKLNKATQHKETEKLILDLLEGNITTQAVTEIAENMGITKEELLKKLKKRNNFSVDELALALKVGAKTIMGILKQQDSSIKIEQVPSLDTDNPEEALIKTQLERQSRKILATLSPREEEVLRLSFGIDTAPEHNLGEVAKIFGITQERIRQIEAQGLRKMRDPSRARRLSPFVEKELQIVPKISLKIQNTKQSLVLIIHPYPPKQSNNRENNFNKIAKKLKTTREKLKQLVQRELKKHYKNPSNLHLHWISIQ